MKITHSVATLELSSTWFNGTVYSTQFNGTAFVTLNIVKGIQCSREVESPV